MDYYGYFVNIKFSWGWVNYCNYNKLIGKVFGVDGIKIGYICVFGFNLMVSVK